MGWYARVAGHIFFDFIDFRVCCDEMTADGD